MSSEEKADVDFERDMPLTAADLEALALARKLPPLPTGMYLEWLALLWRPDGEPRRLNTDADEPFTL